MDQICPVDALIRTSVPGGYRKYVTRIHIASPLTLCRYKPTDTIVTVQTYLPTKESRTVNLSFLSCSTLVGLFSFSSLELLTSTKPLFLFLSLVESTIIAFFTLDPNTSPATGVATASTSMNEPDEPPIDRLGIRDRIHSYVSNLLPHGTNSRHDPSILPITNQQPKIQDGLHTSTGPIGPGPAQEQQPQHVTYDTSAARAIPVDTHDGEKTSALDSDEPKPGFFNKAYTSVKLIILSSWVNWFLLFVPVGIALGAVQRATGDDGPISPTVVFSINAVAIIPLAWMLGYATECVAADMGDTIGALLNVTFGNAVELIIFIIALVADEIAIVQASLLGSILANLLLILGMCFLFGGLRFREQLYNSAVTQMSACLLSLSVISLLLPTAFHASFSTIANADAAVLKVSRGTSVVLLLVYILYLLFQLKSHSYIYESTPQHVIDEESHPGVLADILNSSSSSESSSDDDSDASSGSHTTVKRIRRALRKKRRRKSSSASKDTTSVPSLPSFVRTASSSSQVIDDASTHSPNAKRSGQESVTPEQERPQLSTESSSEVTTRDFTVDPENWATGEKKRKISRYARSKEQKRRNSEEDIIEEGVPFPPLGGEVEGAASKRPFNIRNISYKPALPRALNPNIFSPSQAQPGPLAAAPAPGVGGSNRLRRTSSLPDRLNKSVPGPAAVAAATAIPSAQPLPHLVSKKRVVEVKDDPGEKPKLDRVTAIILLLVTTALVAVCAEFLVDSIDYLVSTTGVSEAFIGLIILPIVGNAAEHVTAVTVASKNKMDLAIGVALGSSIQIALFVTPVIVLLGWILDTEMSLYFSLFETVSLFASAFIVNYLMLDGRSNYLEGALLIAAYVIIAVSAYFYPSCDNTSTLNGGTMTGQC